MVCMVCIHGDTEISIVQFVLVWAWYIWGFPKRGDPKPIGFNTRNGLIFDDLGDPILGNTHISMCIYFFKPHFPAKFQGGWAREEISWCWDQFWPLRASPCYSHRSSDNVIPIQGHFEAGLCCFLGTRTPHLVLPSCAEKRRKLQRKLAETSTKQHLAILTIKHESCFTFGASPATSSHPSIVSCKRQGRNRDISASCSKIRSFAASAEVAAA